MSYEKLKICFEVIDSIDEIKAIHIIVQVLEEKFGFDQSEVDRILGYINSRCGEQINQPTDKTEGE